MTENARAGTFCQSAVFALLVSGVHRKRSAPDDGSFDSTAISYRQARVVAAPFAGWASSGLAWNTCCGSAGWSTTLGAHSTGWRP